MQLEDYRALLTFSRTLSRVSTTAELISVAVATLSEHTPYGAGWIYIYTEEGRVELLATGGDREELRRTTLGVIDAEDGFVQAVMKSTAPVVVVDARLDPRTDKTIVERLDTRTIVNVPLLLHDQLIGAFGGATYGEQGVRPPSEEELAFMSTMGGVIASVLGRLRAEERLRGAQRLESLGLMAGKIAHDFNNLLTVVSSRIELSRRQNPDDEHLAAASHATRMAAELSHQLLAYSGHGKLASRQIELGELIGEMWALLEASLAPGVTVELSEADGCHIEGDPSQIRQVVHNLVINASDAMADSGGRIVIEIAPRGEHVDLVVRDEGVGMDEATRARIFDPYFTTKATGRGLGMAAVLGICRAHDATVSVDTAPGAGTTFTIGFRLTVATEQAPKTRPAATPTAGGRILVVDDDDRVRETMTRLFEGAGLEVRAAASGPQALEDLQTDDAFDLAYVDMTMPQMSGVELLAHLGRLRPGVKAILTSGYCELDTSEIGDVDLVGVVPKPPDVDQLLALVLGALS
jgi:signal transduction histidine kinase/CheY-like chemotaxis protein